MGVKKTMTARGVSWAVDEWISLPDGTQRRFRKRNIPTRELALALVAKVRAEAFEGCWFERRKPSPTVAELWEAYRPVTLANNKSGDKDDQRAGPVMRHIGKLRAGELTVADVERYRRSRRTETTQRGGPPSPATLDREVALLKRICSYAAKARLLERNPLAGVPMLNVPNARSRTVGEEEFQRLCQAAPADLQVALIVAYDTGMRRGEILNLRWSQIDLRERVIRLQAQDTKTKKGRAVMLTRRVARALKGMPRHLHSPYVFVGNNGKPWSCIPKTAWRRAIVSAGLDGLWFHDLRRSFVTNARRKGVPEGVIMRMSGHRTRSVFDRYNIVAEDDLREAVRKLERLTRGVGQDLDNATAQLDEA